ncbi:MAG: type II CAAX endopeptidase family protein [Candidatus Saccharibacteria bacterium]
MVSAARIMPDIRVKRTQALPLAAAILIAGAYILGAAVHWHAASGVLFAAAGLLALWLPTSIRRYMLALLASTLLLAVTPLTTIFTLHMFIIILGMIVGAVLIVYAVSRYFEREHLIHFRFDWRRTWAAWEIAYLVGMVLVVYLLWPYYFRTTGAISGWHVGRQAGEITAVFVSTMITGIWEEFFFTATVLGVLRKYMPFVWANVLQACMFAAFLWRVGFHHWAAVPMFGYAFAQGWVFQKTRSLLYVLVVHVCVDLLVCLILLHAAQPDMMRIFIT